MTAAILSSSTPASAPKVRLASLEAREVLRFRFGPQTKAVPVLFAHQNFKDDKIQWPEKLLPVDIVVDVDPATLNFRKISFDFEDAALKAATPREAETLQETLEKCRKLVRKKILSSHYGCQVDPVKYPGDSEISWTTMERYERTEEGLEIFRISSIPERRNEEEILWRRFEWLMLFFVDATQHTEISDPRWEYFVAKLGDKIVLGFSIYKFPVFPLDKNSERHRIAQFLTIPSFWGQGHAERVLEILHRNIWRANNIDRLTLEDASEGMLALRNVVLLKEVRKHSDWLHRISGNDRPASTIRKELRRTLKVSLVAIDRLIDTVLIAKKFPDLEFQEDERLPIWIVKTEYVRRIKWVPEEIEAMAEGDEKEAAKKEFFQEDWENYVEAAFRAWKRTSK